MVGHEGILENTRGWLNVTKVPDDGLDRSSNRRRAYERAASVPNGYLCVAGKYSEVFHSRGLIDGDHVNAAALVVVPWCSECFGVH